MKATHNANILFEEEQRFCQKWIWLLVGLVAAIGWVTFIQQIVFGTPVGNHPAPDLVVWLILVLIGIGVPWLMYSLRLITRVESSRLVIRFRPLLTREILLQDIANCEARTYRPIREYGGWGIRFSMKHGRAYNVSGNRGVQLTLTDGKKVLIGSQRADELAAIICRFTTGT